jgi:hypothetical protein
MGDEAKAVDAAKLGDAAAVVAALDAGAPIDFKCVVRVRTCGSAQCVFQTGRQRAAAAAAASHALVRFCRHLQTHSRASRRNARQYGQTALSWAANNGHSAVVQLLLERRADVHAKSTRVRPAVRLPRSAALLLTFSLRRATQGGNTPLHLAAHRGHAECARLLIDAGAELNAANDVRSRCLARSCVTAVTAA